ncbi:8-oxoguanine glycosylase [Saccharomycopsis crataegensis]|uniref:DNA-(apurinic or apyrimidinic site) lyase n=1 Tax=Saccharomycopsis crataegensis TaxID=43959 RepID=A0AAV5QNM6_9ASCO|nr:8-oxoguanine glycosylase [Saccharomycopsis crataegensis]
MQQLIWKSVPVPAKEVSLAKVLRCGQAFRWKNIDNVWSCTLKGRVVFLKQDDSNLYYSSLASITDQQQQQQQQQQHDDTLAVIKDYLNLEINLEKLYELWSSKDPNFQKKSGAFSGIRILRQDPWENLVSFICSTNNNVKRISQMCDNLCINFGTYITTHNDIKYYEFPTPQSLAHESVEQKLRDLSFGYRAKYIYKTACQITNSPNGLADLVGLRSLDYKTCHTELLKFTGVGPKVADCVSLMSMDKHDVVPIDTHVWTIAQRDYKFKTGSKTLNSKVYVQTGDFFRELWGEYAGWAHSVLFAADLGDLNNGVNVQDGKAIKNGGNIKKEKVKKENDTNSDKENLGIMQQQQEEVIIYSSSGRPLRGKRKLQMINQGVIKKVKKE